MKVLTGSLVMVVALMAHSIEAAPITLIGDSVAVATQNNFGLPCFRPAW